MLIRATFHEVEGSFDHEILIDPKMSFGTGHHQTTHLMSEYVLDTDVSGQRVLDMGCGTAVLAILAAQKGASRVVGVDNDEWAYRNAVENCERNGQSEIEIRLGSAESLEESGFNLILANINKNVILNHLNYYQALLVKGGRLVLSGFFVEDIEDIKHAALAQELIYEDQQSRQAWARVTFRNREEE